MFLVEQQYLERYKWVSDNMVYSDSRAASIFAVRAQCLEQLYPDPYWASVKFSRASMLTEFAHYTGDSVGLLYGNTQAPDDAISIPEYFIIL